MKRIPLLFCSTAMLLFLSSCGGDEPGGNSNNGDDSNGNAPTALKSIDLDYMDTTISPKEDFFQYANGNWVKDNPVPSTEASWGSFNELSDRNNDLLKEILETAASGEHEKGSIEQLIGDYYYSMMDSSKRDEDGVAPIKEDLDRIAALTSKDEIAAVNAHYASYGIGMFFNLGIEQDLGDINSTITYIGQGGMGLPSKDFYFKDEHAEIRSQYVEHIGKMLMLAGWEEAKAKAAAAACLEIETKLAEAAMDPVQLRQIQAQYNKTATDDFMAMTPSYKWNEHFEVINLTKLDTVVVTQPAFFSNLDGVLNSTSLGDLKSYMTWHLIDNLANALSSDFEKQNFAFYSTTLYGTKEMKPRWKRAISGMQFSALGEAVGHAFVDRAFTAESKERVDQMVTNLMAAFEERLTNIDWMGEETKAKAKEKLANFKRKLGYPDTWTDYSELDITRDSYLKNYMASKKFLVAEELDKLGKPIDKTEWGMPPHMINAYYNPLYNEIVFPAGIMQPPFFDPDAEDAINYGRMGAIIGHEFSHGFDDQGSQFDATGLYNNWWQPEDYQEFGARTSKLVEQFNEYEALPGLYVNGQLTLGENIADLAGLTLSYYAYQKSLEGKERTEVHGFTNEQRFFIGFAQIWKANYTEGKMKQQVATNPHSPPMFRVIGPLANMPEFFEAFDVQEGDKMRRPDDKMTKLW